MEVQPGTAPDYLVFFHVGCPDGVCSAAIATLYTMCIGARLVLFPTDPMRVASTVLQAYKKFPMARHVLMFDVTLNQASFDTLIKFFPHAMAYDHHHTSTTTTPHPQFIVNQSTSGAELTWRHFYPDLPQPDLVSYIGDRDTWKWQLPRSREIAKYMSAHLSTATPADDGNAIIPRAWLDHLQSNQWVETAIAEGTILTNYENTLLKRMASRHIPCWLNNQLVAVLEAPELQSEVSELLYNAVGTLPIEYRGVSVGTPYRYSCVILWSFDCNDQKVRLSLRAAHTPFTVRDLSGAIVWSGPTDVEKIASVFYGGGGHKAAAGGKCKLSDLTYILSQRAPAELRIPV